MGETSVSAQPKEGHSDSAALLQDPLPWGPGLHWKFCGASCSHVGFYTCAFRSLGLQPSQYPHQGAIYTIVDVLNILM